MRPKQILAIIVSAVFFGFMWWVLTEGNTQQWGLGVVVVTLASLTAAMSPMPMGRALFWRRVLATCQFVPYFIYQSLKGGLSVSWFALRPITIHRPEIFEYKVEIPPDARLARMFFASCLCVFPGSLSCGYHGDILSVHCLDGTLYDLKAIRDLEKMIHVIFAPATFKG